MIRAQSNKPFEVGQEVILIRPSLFGLGYTAQLAAIEAKSRGRITLVGLAGVTFRESGQEWPKGKESRHDARA